MSLVDDSLVPWDVGVGVIAPSERGINNSSKGTESGVVVNVDLHVFVRPGAIDVVGEETVIPCKVSTNGFGVGIEEDLVRVES